MVRIADPAERAKALELLGSLSQPIGGALAGGNGRTLDVTQTSDGIRLALTDAAIADKVRHAVGQSIEVLNRRINAMGTKETVIQQQGPNRVLIEVPGSQDTTVLKNMIGQTAKLEFRLVADPGDPPNEAETLPMQKGGGTVQVQKRVMVDGGGPGRRAAELRPADRRAGRQLPLQSARRAEVRPGHVGERRPSLRHRARRQGHLRAGHPFADHRRHWPDHRQFQPRRGLEPRDSLARRRAAGQAHGDRGAHGRTRPRPGLRSTPANARPMSGRRSSSST